jgi:hypothetical protein
LQSEIQNDWEVRQESLTDVTVAFVGQAFPPDTLTPSEVTGQALACRKERLRSMMSGEPSVETIEIRLLIPLQLESELVRRGGGLPGGPIVGEGRPRYERVEKPHNLYTDDFFPSVTRFLFSYNGSSCTFAYWQVPSTTASHWFNGVNISLEGAGTAQAAGVKLATLSGIELFLSDLGVGMLSVSLRLIGFPDLLWVRRLLHRMATMEQGPVTFVRPRRVVDPAKVPVEQQSQINAPPGPDDPLEERLVRRGGAYTWTELVAYLLVPLQYCFGAKRTYRRASCHTVLHMPEDWDFLDIDLRRGVKPFLSSLAQLYSQTHPGEISGRSHSSFFRVSRTHIAAVSLTGAAHAVTRQPADKPDQASGHSYDELHQLRAHNTYFVPYLLASLQRLVLHQFLEEAQKSLSAPADDPGILPQEATSVEPRFLALRRAVVKFGLTGELLEISQRGTLQSYYRVAHEVSDVPRALEQLRAVISEWDGIERAARLHETVQRLRDNVESLERIQGEVGWVEVVIISVYVVQLGQIVGQGFGIAGSVWHGVSLLVLSALATGLAYACGFFPGKHKGAARWQKLVFLGVFGLILVYLAWNFSWSWFGNAKALGGGARIAPNKNGLALPPSQPDVEKAINPAPSKSEFPSKPPSAEKAPGAGSSPLSALCQSAIISMI